MTEEIILSIVAATSVTVIGLAALWRKKNVELQVVARKVGVQLRISEPGQRRLTSSSGDPGLGGPPQAE
ncbi:hypothetical protein [Longimicrobium sp.]|jgi:hypothetical protein|uniref:hypothetical protein n=1 Tax=Longimicrobium sp. TaxID=2029185 RepID=UPI002ED86380